MNIKEELFPNIIIGDEKDYGLNNFFVLSNVDFGDNDIGDNDIKETENHILEDNNINKGDNSKDYLSKKIEIGEKVKRKEGDYIIIRKHFRGIFDGGFTSFIEENPLLADYIHKDVYEKLKENIIIRIFDKLVNGSLKISDIVEKFNIKIGSIDMDYNFSISIDLNVGTYEQEGKHTNYYNHNVYSLNLFNYSGKGYFDLNKINLLTNNYQNLKPILPKSDSNSGTKVYYTLSYKFDSSYLSDFNGEINLNLDF